MSYLSEVLADSPLLLWKMDESSGTTAADATGNGRTGTISATGVTYSAAGAITADPTATALTFNGTAGNIKSAATMNPATNKVTFECIASFPSFNNTDDLMAEFSPQVSSNAGSFYVDPCAAGGAWDLAMNVGAGPTRIRAFTRPSTGVYHHLVFVFDASAATSRWVAYVDNVVQTLSGTGNTGSANFGTYNLNVASRNAANLFLAATIQMVAFYAGELSSARVAVHFAAITAGDFVPKVIVI